MAFEQSSRQGEREQGATSAQVEAPAAGKQTRSEQGAEGGVEQQGRASRPAGGEHAEDWKMTPELSSAMGLSAEGAGAGASSPTPGARDPNALRDTPSATYLVPFDRAPLSSPGERIICVAEFTGGSDADYEISYSTVGGHFDTSSGATSKTIPGLMSGNVNFFVPSPWDGATEVSVTMQLKRRGGAAVQTESWRFGKKAHVPTTMTQREDGSERDLPGVYTYDIGPERRTGSKPFYEHQTILETFGNWSIGNIVPADIQETYRTTHSLTSVAAISAHSIGTYAGNNGTFTVDSDDQIADQHGGHPNVDTLANNLATPKEIQVVLPQTYESSPGTALGRYNVTRVRKTDGTWKVKKESR